jgi:enterochelin esterase-like enzyme
MDAQGELVTEAFPYDGGRQVAVYLPPSPAQAVVYAGDGQLISTWGPDLEQADVPPTMVVGVYRTDDADQMVRIREYSPSFEPAQFAAHETFFVDEVRDWVRRRFGVALPPERTAVCGVSASAELALAMGMRHPDIYGSVFAASPGGGYQPPEVMPDKLPRAYLVAGTEEPWFMENAARWSNALQAANADVILTERPGNHGDPFWQAEFPLMINWAFGN